MRPVYSTLTSRGMLFGLTVYQLLMLLMLAFVFMFTNPKLIAVCLFVYGVLRFLNQSGRKDLLLEVIAENRMGRLIQVRHDEVFIRGRRCG